jgi:YggT family protein
MVFALASTLLWVFNTVVDLYIFVIIAAVVVSWLIAFNVINTRNEAVRVVLRILAALTEPVFRQVRRVIPPIGGLDLAPLIVWLLLVALQHFVNLAYANAYIGIAA